MSRISELWSTEGMPIVPAAKVLGLTTTAMLAGASASSAYLLVPILRRASSDPAIFSAQWRLAQQIDFYTAAPQGLIAGLTWTWLALTTPQNTPVRWLYTITAIIVPSVVPFSVLVQRKIGSRVAWPLADPDTAEKSDDAMILTTWWARHQYGRATVVALASVIGGWAAFNEAFLGGLQVGLSFSLKGLLRNDSGLQLQLK